MSQVAWDTIKNLLGDGHDECMEESGATKTSLLDFLNWAKNSDPKLKDYLTCMFKLAGLENEDGTIQKIPLENMMDTFLNNKYKVSTLFKKCKTVAKSTAFAMLNCLLSNERF